MEITHLDYIAELAVSLAIGLLVGSERGWHTRKLEEGNRVAGIRTFTLIALLGGITAVFSRHLLPDFALLVCVAVFLCLTAILTAGYFQSARTSSDLSITTEVAAMLVFWLGTLPAFGFAVIATAIAVILALLLHMKKRLHYWLQVLDERELLGTLQFLLVSVVMLPLLPNQGYGPWEALNPYQLWWMVVLISGLSLIGYFAMRVVGPGRGILVTSLTGGLVSSTSLTISLSKMHQEIPHTREIGAGILLACATMFARVVVVIGVIRPTLIPHVLTPMALGFFTLLGLALWRYRSGRGKEPHQEIQVKNPFQLIPAIQFGALLGAVMLLAQALRAWLGDAGLYLLSIATGIADVDAIVLSLGPKAGAELGELMVVTCIALAAATNTVIKGVYCRVIAGPELGRPVLLSTAATAVLVLLNPAAVWLI